MSAHPARLTQCPPSGAVVDVVSSTGVVVEVVKGALVDEVLTVVVTASGSGSAFAGPAKPGAPEDPIRTANAAAVKAAIAAVEPNRSPAI
ncbi:hypothetical protein [[Mycobacterium] nativiensis]|uniref:Uncharacterized protein n=1 Tax=[Mycobacterium] nativiensis TaxID=2855503 RepID=A0ABU5XYX4_9MYCO|nr:hypothetical protein [Mycolicibacter sp. MYC340]MEB3033199.1 hypothetical protein [Mycolicibacter sp. MYC340]